MGAATGALTAFEVAVRGRRAALAGLKPVGIHRKTHGATCLTPVKARLDQDIGNAFLLRHLLDEAGAGNAASNERAFDPADVDLAQLKQLQSDELAMAADDRDCQAEYFRPVYLEVRSAAEQRFVDRNGDLPDALAKLSGLG